MRNGSARGPSRSDVLTPDSLSPRRAEGNIHRAERIIRVFSPEVACTWPWACFHDGHHPWRFSSNQPWERGTIRYPIASGLVLAAGLADVVSLDQFHEPLGGLLQRHLQ